MNLLSSVPVAPLTTKHRSLLLREDEAREHDFVAHKSQNCASSKTLKLRFLDATLGLLFQNLMSSSLANSPSSHQVSDGIRPAEEVKI